MKIGIFDSGFGGLNIMKSIVDRLPQYDYVYFGDTARTPYGTRSQKLVYEYTREAIDFLFEQDCQLIILACNSASAEALRKIQQEFLPEKYPDRRVLGVLIPASEGAIEKSSNKSIGVLATEGTVSSGAFEREIKKLNPGATIVQQACSLLVPIVESGEIGSESESILNPILDKYLKPIVESGVDSLILGCTHYGIIENQINESIKRLGGDIFVINEGGIVAEKLEDYLSRHSEIDEKLSTNGTREFYTTDLTDRFVRLGSQFYGQKIEVKRADL
jgi:glutamate racemase